MLSRLPLILEKLLLLNLAYLHVSKEQNAKIPDDTQCEDKIERSRVIVVRGSDNGTGTKGPMDSDVVPTIPKERKGTSFPWGVS